MVREISNCATLAVGCTTHSKVNWLVSVLEHWCVITQMDSIYCLIACIATKRGFPVNKAKAELNQGLC